MWLASRVTMLGIVVDQGVSLEAYMDSTSIFRFGLPKLCILNANIQD